MKRNDDVDRGDDVNSNAVRPNFLSLKRDQFFPSLPSTPENGSFFEEGFSGSDVMKWDILASSTLNDTLKTSYFDDVYDVFSMRSQQSERRSELCKKTLSAPQSRLSKKEKKKEKLFDNTQNESLCCSDWLRAFIRKLWVKAPPEPPSEGPKPQQLSILERDFMRRPKSPRGMKRVSRKRHNATSQFICFFEDSVREVGEEIHEDVIYSITVKKDTLPRNSSPSKSLSEADLLQKGTTRHLKGATFDHMVGRLARVFMQDNDDVNFLNVFLTTYRTFATPEELLNQLSDEYMKLKAESSVKNRIVLKSIARVLRAWLERYSQDDFYEAPDHQQLRKLLALAKIHDDDTKEKIDDVTDCNQRRPPASPTSPRKNGVVMGCSFADYVAAKLAVAGKAEKDNEKLFSSPLASPTHTQNPKLDLTTEFTTLNAEPAKQLLLVLSPRHVAAQLTVIAAKLFHRVQPHHCLAAVCSKNRPATVRGTIDQFNRVVYCVMGTCLCPSLKPSQRTKLLTKWIEVAQECRELKNFSSLHAIVSGLKTHAIHQLKKAWQAVPHSNMNLLKELGEINMKDLIMKVGTAKVNTEDSSITRIRKDAAVRRTQDINLGIMHGTVPYLGSFLTDLTYLDTARPDFLKNGMINFEKRREEFELLAQLQLWQASCRSYQHLEPDPPFMQWFKSVTVLTDAQACELSEMIEPKTVPMMSSPAVSSPLIRTISDMLSPAHSDAESSNGSNKISRKHENGMNGVLPSQSTNGRVDATNRIVKIRLVRNRTKTSEGDVTDKKDKAAKDDITKQADLNSSCEYKTITISTNERTSAVIKKSLEAYMLDVETNLKKFSLVQILQDSQKEIQIPDSSNVFYAMSSSDLKPTLVLLEEGAEIPAKVKRHQSTPHKAKKHRHRKNHSVSYARSRDSSPSRFSSRNLANAAASSPMRSFYRQIALGSVALVGGSYSPTQAARRSSDGEEAPNPSVAASDTNVILLDSRKSASDAEKEIDPLRRHMRQIRASMSDAELSKRADDAGHFNRSYSVDYSSTVVLPVRVVRSSVAISAHQITSRSAPCSPRMERKNTAPASFAVTSSHDVITATSTLTERSRYVATNAARSGTWSSRRALRKHRKKHQSTSTFYVRKGEPEVNFDGNETREKDRKSSSSRSKFYIDINAENEHRNEEESVDPAKSVPIARSVSKTLPPRLVPDYTGHDDDEEPRDPPEQRHVTIATPKLKSFTSISSNHSAAPSDDGSCISFVASPEDNVFDDENSLSPTWGTVRPPLTDLNPTKRDNTEEAPRPPVIKIQCASPETYPTDESDLFRGNIDSGHVSKSEENNSDAESDRENNTYL